MKPDRDPVKWEEMFLKTSRWHLASTVFKNISSHLMAGLVSFIERPVRFDACDMRGIRMQVSPLLSAYEQSACRLAYHGDKECLVRGM